MDDKNFLGRAQVPQLYKTMDLNQVVVKLDPCLLFYLVSPFHIVVFCAKIQLTGVSDALSLLL